MNQQKTRKDIVAKFDDARELCLKEQNVYRERLKILEEQCDAKSANEKLLKINWDGILDRMKDEIYPPTWEDRKNFLKIEFGDELTRQKLDKIPDRNIAAAIHFYLQVYEHTKRIRAHAKFCEIVEAETPEIDKAFGFWQFRTVFNCLKHEANEMNMPKKAKSLEKCVSATDGITRLLLPYILHGYVVDF